jgi:hypothetical protein
MMFQSSLAWQWTTGGARKAFCVPPRGLAPKFTLFRKGKLMRSLTGFWF